jgi:hypothetical protein
MPKVELIYFSGCPNIGRARSVLRTVGFENFREIDQGHLSQLDPRATFSSPTVTVDGKIIVGNSHSGAACSIIDWQSAEQLLINWNKTEPIV